MCLKNLGPAINYTEPFKAWKVVRYPVWASNQRYTGLYSDTLAPANKWLQAVYEGVKAIGFSVFRRQEDAEAFKDQMATRGFSKLKVESVECRGLCRRGKALSADSSYDAAYVEYIKFPGSSTRKAKK